VRIEWDPKKDAANRAKHDLSFEDASRLFRSGVDYLEIYDAEHSSEEDRFFAIGPIDRGIITVVCTERSEDSIRIISARRATRSEVGLFRRYVRASES
jgi:hypothetical protein